jgi:hypothetical protein
MDLNFIDLLCPYLKGDKLTNETLQAMTDYYRGGGGEAATWTQDYMHCVNWCNLADYLYNHRGMKWTAEVRFHIGNHATDCYWYEVLSKAAAFATRTIDDVMGRLQPQQLPAMTGWEVEELRKQVNKVRMAVGVISYIVREIEQHCPWAQKHMEETWDGIQDSWVTLRILGYWITGLLWLAQKKFGEAANTMHALTQITFREMVDHRPAHEDDVDCIHANAWIQLHVALGYICESQAIYGLAEAHYMQAHKLGHVLTPSQELMIKNNHAVFMQPAPETQDLMSRMKVAIRPVPNALFVLGEPVIGRIKLVFKQ